MTRGGGAAGAAFFLGAALRAADLARRTSFLPAFLAFLAAAFTFRFTFATRLLARGLAFRRALVFAAFLRAPFFLGDFRADFFLAALAMNHLREVRSPRAIKYVAIPAARS